MTPRHRPTKGESVSRISQRSVSRSIRGYQSQEEQNGPASYAEDYVIRQASAPASRGVRASGRAVRTISRKATRALKPVAEHVSRYAGQQIRKAMPRTTHAFRELERKKTDSIQRFQRNMPRTAATMRTAGRAIGATARFTKRAAKPLAKGVYQTGATAHAFVGATDAGFQSGAVATEAAIRTSTSLAAKPVQKLASRSAKAAFKPVRKIAARGLKAAGQAVLRLMGKVALAAGKALLSMIMSFGAPGLVIIAFFAVILMLIASPFGIFMGGESPGKPTYPEAAAEIDAGLQERINEISRTNPHDALVVEFLGGSGNARINNWPDILAVYATKTTTDSDHALDVVEIDEVKTELLRTVWEDMTEIKHHSKTTRTTDEETGEVDKHTTLYISVIAKNRSDMYTSYSFDDEQKNLTEELAMNDEFIALAQMISISAAGTGMQIGGQNLPESAYASELVRLAATRLGDPYSQALRGEDDYVDCSSLVQWAYYELGVNVPGTAAAQAKYCSENGYAVSKDNLQPGDLVFWSLKRDGEWIQPDRYMNVSHVGIYAGDGKVIEASSSAGQVVLRDIWGTQTMFARIL